MKPVVASLSWASALAGGAMAGASYPPVPADLSTPTQQRIAIKGPNSISVGWNTHQQMSEPCVQYGTASNNLKSTACSRSSITYPNSRTYVNTVVLSGLAPATTYYYKIVSTNSSVEEFFSPRSAGDKTSFSFNAVIDMGVYGEDGYTIAMDGAHRDTIPNIEPALNHTTIGRLASTIDDYELIVHPGDIAYADDWIFSRKNLFDGRDAYAAITEQFHGQLAPIAARKPYMVGPGNHEASCEELPGLTILCPAGQRNFTDYRMRYTDLMPTISGSVSSNDTMRAKANEAQVLANPPFWYSFEYGMLHYIMIDTETDFYDAPDEPGGTDGLNSGPFGRTARQQLAFLEADLQSVDRSVTPWVVVGGHRPWYTVGGHACMACQRAFEPILYKYGVDLGIFGHEHNSQRFMPVYKGEADPNGMEDPDAPMYIVSGGAGNIEGLGPIVGPEMSFNPWNYAEDFSYSRITLMDEQHLRVQFIQSSTGDVIDESVLFKSHDTDNFVSDEL
ncbi:Metallo-dependent phosphatase-like protein [Xylaria sp. CBS 124048]|nr:Metallo-dependent phosphatase-like protein [Xylaria sp. CBS 124048]